LPTACQNDLVSTYGRLQNCSRSIQERKPRSFPENRPGGLWDRWKDPSGTWGKSCSILTTTPNAVTSAVHDRMPIILDPSSHDLWLDPGMTSVDAASDLLKPFDPQLMRCYPVSSRINHVANDDAECSAPAEVPQPQPNLFLSMPGPTPGTIVQIDELRRQQIDNSR
jgi:hypothetical protein